jgi:hypothetical protein
MLETRLALAAPDTVEIASDWADEAEMIAQSPSGGQLAVASPILTDAHGLPLLESLPGAPVAMYLDFDGHIGSGGVPTYAPYSIDSNGATFNAQEQANIVEGWTRVAAYFSTFHVNVTTIEPTAPRTWTIISPTATANNSRGEFNPSRPSSVIRQGHFLSRTSVLLHEIGHDFGLQHLAEFDLKGHQTAEYRGAIDPLHAPIMGLDFDGSVPKWYHSHPAGNPSILQDDIATIASKVAFYEPAGGDGFRPDDFSEDVAAAFELPEVGAGLRSADGIVERLEDVDMFSFASPGAAHKIQAKRRSLSGVDLKLDLYDTSGRLVAASDSEVNDQTLEIVLPPGAYFVAVSSHGDYGDIGPYTVSVSPSSIANEPAAGNGLSPPSMPLAVGGIDSVALSWTAVTGATGYVVERSMTGAAFEQAGVTEPNTTTFVDAGRADHQRYFYRVRAKDATGNSLPSTVANAVTRPAAVNSLTVTSWTDTALVLNWLDISGETGYRIERSVDGVAFEVVGTVSKNTPSFTDAALAEGATYNYRVITLDGVGDAAMSATASGQTRFSTFAEFRIASVAANRIVLSWNDMHNESRYRIERSSDGANYTDLTFPWENVTMHEDVTVLPHTEYYYRISSIVGEFVEVQSVPVIAATPTSQPQIDHWLSVDIGETAGPGSARVQDGQLSLISAGLGLDGTADSVRFLFRAIAQDETLIARVTSLENTDERAMVGLMIRESLEADARSVVLATTPRAEASLSFRESSGTMRQFIGDSPGGRQWLKLSRAGDTISGSVSVDGNVWTQLGETIVTPMNEEVFIGIFASSANAGQFNTSTFADLRFGLPVPSARDDSYTLLEDAELTESARAVRKIATGAAWKYMFNAWDLGTTWRETNNPVGFGSTGASPLGYGHPKVKTTIPNTQVAIDRLPSAYFRKDVVLNDAAAISRLVFDVAYDDGIAIYLNGMEVFRENLAQNASFASLAFDSVEAETWEYRHFELDASLLPPDLLLEGRNVLAVEVHQASILSDDLWFDMVLDVEWNDTVGLLRNDSNVADNENSAILVSPPQHGSVAVAASGAFTYQPDANYSGTDSFAYRVTSNLKTILPVGSRWRYLDNGSDQGHAWHGTAFDDSHWASGVATFGYGNGTHTTPVEPGPAGATFATSYFRKRVFLPDGATADGLVIRLKRNDAAAVYINGVEVYRDPGLLADATFGTFASEPLSPEESNAFFEVPVGATLHAGDNVVAVEVHASSADDESMAFDFELLGRMVSAPATVALTIAPVWDSAVAADDAYVLGWNRTLSGNDSELMGNDVRFEDGYSQRMVITRYPQQGNLEVNGESFLTFTYDPFNTARGQDSFSYALIEPANTVLLSKASDWKYLDDGSNQGTTWREVEFDDAAWPSGAGLFGHRGDFQATSLRCPVCVETPYITAYFRTAVFVENAAVLADVIMNLFRGTSAIVYLNGEKVLHDAGLPDEPAYDTPSSDSGTRETTFDVNPESFVTGWNVLAVEVHRYVHSPVLGFGLEIVAKQAASEATVTITFPEGDLDGNGFVDASDVNSLVNAIHLGPSDDRSDFTGDGQVDIADLDHMIFNLVRNGSGTRYGDLDFDGLVNRRDASNLANWFGGTVPSWSAGDLNASGSVDLADLAILQANLGFVAPDIPPTAAAAMTDETDGATANAVAWLHVVAVERPRGELRGDDAPAVGQRGFGAGAKRGRSLAVNRVHSIDADEADAAIDASSASQIRAVRIERRRDGMSNAMDQVLNSSSWRFDRRNR